MRSPFSRWLGRQRWLNPMCVTSMALLAGWSVCLAAFYVTAAMYGWALAHLAIAWVATRLFRWMAADR